MPAGDFAGAQAIDKMVLYKHAGDVAVVLRHGEVVVEADLQRSWLEFRGVVGAVLRIMLRVAVAEVPFADGRRLVAVRLEQGGHVESPRLDEQRREGAERFVFQRGAPAVAAREQRVARRRANRGSRVRIRKAASLARQPVDIRRAHEARIRAKAADASVAEIVGENDDDVGRVRNRFRGAEINAAKKKKDEERGEFHEEPESR